EPSDRPQERRLAGAIRPDQRHPLPRSDRRRDAVEHPTAPEVDRQSAKGQRRGLCNRLLQSAHGPTMRLVRRTIAKNGAPKKAVTTPIGNSAGDIAVRAITAAKTRNPAPT